MRRVVRGHMAIVSRTHNAKYISKTLMLPYQPISSWLPNRELGYIAENYKGKVPSGTIVEIQALSLCGGSRCSRDLPQSCRAVG